MKTCSHLQKANLGVQGKTKGCEECEKKDLTGFTCDYVYHVVMSAAVILLLIKHGTKHFGDSGHPVIRSYEPGENWKWCYLDEQFMK
jgi:hypothetical protein